MGLSERKEKIIKAVVDSYIDSCEPVSSADIKEHHLPSLSTATIRNELATLEEMGYLDQPHTSAGRVPTANAYRLYVEKLMPARKITPSEIAEGVNRLKAVSHRLEMVTNNKDIRIIVAGNVFVVILPAAGDFYDLTRAEIGKHRRDGCARTARAEHDRFFAPDFRGFFYLHMSLFSCIQQRTLPNIWKPSVPESSVLSSSALSRSLLCTEYMCILPENISKRRNLQNASPL